MRPSLTSGQVAVSVAALGANIESYSDLSGLQLIAPVAEIDSRPGHFWDIVAGVFGSRLPALRLALVCSANRIALEMFQFVELAYDRREEVFEYWKGGFSHMCFVEPEVEARRADAHTSDPAPVQGRAVQNCHCEDQWGPVIGLYSRGHVQTFANQAGGRND